MSRIISKMFEKVGRLRSDDAARRSLLMLSVRISGAFVNACPPLLLTYFFSAETFGTFVYFSSVILTFDTMMQIYLGTSGTRQMVSRANIETSGGDFAASFALLLLTASAVGIATWVLIGLHGVGSQTAPTLLLSLIWPIATVIVRSSEISFRVSGKPMLGFLVSQTLPIVIVTALICLARLTGFEVSALHVMAMYACGLSVSIALSARTTVGHFSSLLKIRGFAWIHQRLPTILVTSIPVIGELLPAYIMGSIHEFKTVGLFEVIRRFVWLTGFISSATWAVHSVGYAQLVDAGDFGGVKASIAKHRRFVRPLGVFALCGALSACLIYLFIAKLLTLELALYAALMTSSQLAFFSFWPASTLALTMNRVAQYHLSTLFAIVLGIAMFAALYKYNSLLAVVAYWTTMSASRGILYAIILGRALR